MIYINIFKLTYCLQHKINITIFMINPVINVFITNHQDKPINVNIIDTIKTDTNIITKLIQIFSNLVNLLVGSCKLFKNIGTIIIW